MKYFLLLAAMLITACSSVPSSDMSNSDKSSEASAQASGAGNEEAQEPVQQGFDSEGKYEVNQEYKFNDLLVYIGGVTAISEGVWVGVYFENSGGELVEIDFRNARVAIDGAMADVNISESDDEIISNQLSAQTSTQGTFAFLSESPLNLQYDSIKNITLFLGKAYTDGNDEAMNIDINLSLN